MAILHHVNCENKSCQRCYDDHTSLSDELEERTGDSSVDHLGRYRMYLEKKYGLDCETEHGWAYQYVFDEKYISEYVNQYSN